MRHTDVVIAGAGLAGSAAAAMLAEAGTDVLLIDPREVYPPDFRCEKLDVSQIEILHKTGLADAVLSAATPDRSLAIARFGRLVEQRDGRQCGIHYADLVNTVREQVPATAFLAAKVEIDRNQCRPADTHAVERRAGVRAIARAGDRAQSRPASSAWPRA